MVKQQRSVTIDYKLIEKVEKIAKEKDRSFSFIVNEILKKEVEEWLTIQKNIMII